MMLLLYKQKTAYELRISDWSADVCSSDLFVAAALVLALLSGLILLLMGVLRLVFLANLLSHPVVSGFITASGIIIAFSQFKSILGVSASGETLPELIDKLVVNLPATHLPTLAIGAATTAFLFWVRKGLKPLLVRAVMAPRPADPLATTGPIAAVAASTLHRKSGVEGKSV